MIKILIADDHPIIRYGIKQIISDEKDMIVKDEANSGMQTLEFLKKNKYDILILDINFPDINGFEILNMIKRYKFEIRVLVLSVLPEKQYAIKVIESGAAGYLNKMAASEQLIKAIRKIIGGSFYINPALSENIIALINNTAKKKIRHENLSRREFEVMCMLASGKAVRDIANNLLLSIPTVYTYRSKILDKMNMKTDSEIVQYCFKEGLLN